MKKNENELEIEQTIEDILIDYNVPQCLRKEMHYEIMDAIHKHNNTQKE